MSARKKGRPRSLAHLAHLPNDEYRKVSARIRTNEWLKNNPEKKKQYNAASKESPAAKVKHLVGKAKLRAAEKSINFSIIPEHVYIPHQCPLREDEINYANSETCDNSPSIDRFDPTKGYEPGNVWVISQRANRIKNNATFEEFEKIYLNWRAEMIRRGLIKP